jgi:hypothetical protein
LKEIASISPLLITESSYSYLIYPVEGSTIYIVSDAVWEARASTEKRARNNLSGVSSLAMVSSLVRGRDFISASFMVVAKILCVIYLFLSIYLASFCNTSESSISSKSSAIFILAGTVRMLVENFKKRALLSASCLYLDAPLILTICPSLSQRNLLL